MDSLQAAATSCRGFRRVLPKNRDDENRVEAIERELIKLGSEVDCATQSRDCIYNVRCRFLKDTHATCGCGSSVVKIECRLRVPPETAHFLTTDKYGHDAVFLCELGTGQR